MSEHVCELTAIDSETWDMEQREEVVRCKDCAYMEQQTTYDGSMSWFLCTHFDRPTRRDGFCAWGESK